MSIARNTGLAARRDNPSEPKLGRIGCNRPRDRAGCRDFVRAAWRRVERPAKERPIRCSEPNLSRTRGVVKETRRPGQGVIGRRIVDHLCVVNAESTPDYGFALPPPDVDEADPRCHVFAGVGERLLFITQPEIECQVATQPAGQIGPITRRLPYKKRYSSFACNSERY